MTPKTICIDASSMNPKSEGMIIRRDESQPYVTGIWVKRHCGLHQNNGIIIVRIFPITPYNGIIYIDVLFDRLLNKSNPYIPTSCAQYRRHEMIKMLPMVMETDISAGANEKRAPKPKTAKMICNEVTPINERRTMV